MNSTEFRREVVLDQLASALEMARCGSAAAGERQPFPTAVWRLVAATNPLPLRLVRRPASGGPAVAAKASGSVTGQGCLGPCSDRIDLQGGDATSWKQTTCWVRT